MLDALQYQVLKKIAPVDPQVMRGSAYEGTSKIGFSLGDNLLALVRDKTVIDFGCGDGTATLDLARAGARKVIGLDILTHALDKATRLAAANGLSDRCEFTTHTGEKADVIV